MFGIYNFTQLQSYIAELYQGRRVDIRPFGYTLDFDTIAAGASGVSTQKTFGNADFLVCSIGAGIAENSNALLPTTLQIVDSGSEERFFDSPAPVAQVACIQSSPLASIYRGLTIPRKVAGNSLLTATLTVAAAGEEITSPQIYLDGVHVYIYGG